MLSRVFWLILNVLQVLFLIIWSVLLQTAAILVRLVTFSANTPLWMARAMWAPPLIAGSGGKLKIHHEDRLRLDRPAVYLFNHQSAFDIAVAFVSIPVPLRFVAKRELLYIPFLGWYMWATGMIFVDRGKGAKAIRSLRRAAKQVRDGANIIAFPEGTRSDDGRIGAFKKGMFVLAIEAGVPIVPVAIVGSRDVMPKNSFRFRPGLVNVNIGEPIPTEGLTYKDRLDLMERTRAALIALHVEVGGPGGAEPGEDARAA